LWGKVLRLPGGVAAKGRRLGGNVLCINHYSTRVRPLLIRTPAGSCAGASLPPVKPGTGDDLRPVARLPGGPDDNRTLPPDHAGSPAGSDTINGVSVFTCPEALAASGP
jgi:hypothetical protein